MNGFANLKVNIDRWIDINGPDFKRMERHTFILKIINIGIEGGIIQVDSAGYMWQKGNPVYGELDGQFVGLRYAAKAIN